MAVNHLHGKFTSEQWQAYRQDMRKPSEKLMYERIGNIMRWHAHAEPSKKTRNRDDLMLSTLRCMREASKRSHQPWDPKAATLKLLEARRHLWEQEWEVLLRSHRAHQAAKTAQECGGTRRLAVHGWCKPSPAAHLLPSQAGALFRELDTSTGVKIWSWVYPVGDRVKSRIFRCGLSGE